MLLVLLVAMKCVKMDDGRKIRNICAQETGKTKKQKQQNDIRQTKLDYYYLLMNCE